MLPFLIGFPGAQSVTLRKPQRIDDHRNRAERHGQAGDHRAQQQPEERIEHARRDRHAQGVVEKRKGEVLADVGHGRPAETAGADDAAQVALDQRHAGALHGDVGAGAHRDADVGLGKRGRVVDAVAGHGDDAALRPGGA